MTRGLELVLAELESGHLSPGQLHENPQQLKEKVFARLRRGVGMLTRARASANDQTADR